MSNKTFVLEKNLFSDYLVESVSLLRRRDPDCSPGLVSNAASTFYFKLPYIGPFSSITQKRICHLITRYCNNSGITLALASFKIGNMFGLENL